MVYVTFGRMVQEARRGLGLSQKELARETNIQLRMITRYEQDHCEPYLSTALKLGKYLGISLDELRESVKLPGEA